MKVTQIDLGFKQRITVGNRDKYDSLEIYVGGQATLTENESPEDAAIELAVILKGHLEKELQLAAQKPSQGAQSLVEAKSVTMAPVQQAPVPQQFTQKTSLGECGGCGTAIKDPKTMEVAARKGVPPLCFTCWKKTPAGQEWSRNKGR